jgi:hypothetical protein
MKLINEPWDQVLDLVLRNFSLDKRIEGNNIEVAPSSLFATEEGNIHPVSPEATEPPTFEFVKLKKMIPVLKRDYIEIIKNIETECWKSAIILCGSSIEGILYDVLKQSEKNALVSREAPKDKNGWVLPLEKWSLTALMNTASDLFLIKKAIKGFSHTIRDYRNLVHPVNEADGNYTLEKEEADNSFIILNMLIRDLTKGN